MNLTLYAITAFIILDTDGNRVLSKYYRQETTPSGTKGLAHTKEQRAFEKGLWQKTKKSGGPSEAPVKPTPSFDSPLLRSRNNVPALRCVLDICWTNTGDIILYDGRLAVYKHSLDLIFYLIANQDENELMVNAALSAFSDAVHMLLRNQVEKRAVLENLDLVLLCLDETIDDGCVAPIPRIQNIAPNGPFFDRPPPPWLLRANVTLLLFAVSSWTRIRRQ